MEPRFREYYKTFEAGGVTFYYNSSDIYREPLHAIYGCDGGDVAVFPAIIDDVPVRHICTSEDFLGQGFTCREASLPEGVTMVRQQAFYSNRQLEEVILPHSMEVLGWRSFAFCPALKRIALPMRLLLHLIPACKGSQVEESCLRLDDGGLKVFARFDFMNLIAYYYSIIKKDLKGQPQDDDEDRGNLALCKEFGWHNIVDDYLEDFQDAFNF